MMAHRLAKLQRLAIQKEEEIKQIEYNKYKHIYDIAIKYLKTQHVLLYGGTAINDVMPDDLKLYKNNELPDIDVFAVDALTIAKGMVKYFNTLGYQLTSFNDALHENTYRVYVNGLQVTDISMISADVYRRLHRGHVKSASTGLKIVNPMFLRMSLHLMMSHPYTAHRWTKIYTRLLNFYKVYPLPMCQSHDTLFRHKNRSVQDDVLCETFVEWMKGREYISFGGTEVQKYLYEGQEHPIHMKGTMYDILVGDDLASTARDFIQYAQIDGLGMTEIYHGNDIVPTHVFVTINNTRVFGMYEVTDCTSFVTFTHYGLRIASFHAMCQLYMSLMFSPYSHHKKTHIQCIVNMLGQLQSKIITTKNSKRLFNQFVMDCYGPFEGMATLKRKQIQRMKERR